MPKCLNESKYTLWHKLCFILKIYMVCILCHALFCEIIMIWIIFLSLTPWLKVAHDCGPSFSKHVLFIITGCFILELQLCINTVSCCWNWVRGHRSLLDWDTIFVKDGTCLLWGQTAGIVDWKGYWLDWTSLV